MPPQNEHEQNQILLHQFYARQRAAQEAREARAQAADAVLSDVCEENEALAHAAGLTEDEYHNLLHEHGLLGAEALKALIEQPELETPEEAIAFLYRQAGYEAGKYADWLTKASGERQIPRELARLDRITAKHEHPRRRRPKGKGQVIERYKRWKAEQERIAGDDASFDELRESFQEE